MVDSAPSEFVLLAGDVLSLKIASLDKVEVPVVVDGAGKINVPAVGQVALGGLDLASAERRVEGALRERDRFAQASLTVTEAGGHRATVVGAVEHPGEYALRPLTRVADLIAMSAGPKSAVNDAEAVSLADLSGARVMRGGVALPLSVGRALSGDPLHNVRIMPGDLLYVPESHGQRISVLGEVHTPKVVNFRSGLRLTEALAMAGGTTGMADNSDIRVVRGSLAAPRVYCASLRALVAGESHDVVLEPGDVVFVTEHWLASVTQVVGRLAPALAASALTYAVTR
jgi:polysaccharide biosynthesis/export protein